MPLIRRQRQNLGKDHKILWKLLAGKRWLFKELTINHRAVSLSDLKMIALEMRGVETCAALYPEGVSAIGR